MDENQQQPGGVQSDPLLHDPVPPQPVQTPRKHGRKKLVLFAVGGIVVTSLVAGAAYWFVLREKPTDKNTGQQASAQPEQGHSAEDELVPPDGTPEIFKSNKLGIELTRRNDWTLKESSDGAISITSRQTSYTASDGTSKTGVFTLRIRKGASDAQRATIDKSIATRDSEVIGYTAPAEGQREYTNLSFAGPKDMFGFFVVTGNTEFKAGAPYMYSLSFDGSSYLIAGGYGADAANSLGFDSVPKDHMDSTTLDQAIDIVESLKIY